jgi:pimeloyl-ACP methyl ester carboxylesterase
VFFIFRSSYSTDPDSEIRTGDESFQAMIGLPAADQCGLLDPEEASRTVLGQCSVLAIINRYTAMNQVPMRYSIVPALNSFLFLFLCACIVTAQVQAPSPVLSPHKPEPEVKHVSFTTEDSGVIYADLYGSSERGVVLAHGGRFTKESWQPQAEALVRAGFRVLAFDFRGIGESHGPGDKDMDTAPMHLDVLAAVRYLRKSGAKTVSVMGGSFGGSAAADASIASEPGEIDRLILLAASGSGPAERIKSPLLVIVARDDASGDGPRLPHIRAWFEKAPEPKQLIVLDGSAHAQFLFQTEQGARVMNEVLRFLTAKN